MTRIIVCGGRDFSDRALCFKTLDELLPKYDCPEIVSGHASGADQFGEEYAKEHGLQFQIFKPDWKKYGKSAGPIRNRQMLMYALETTAVIIAFWDGESKGTKNMISQAQNAGAKVHIIRYE
jgi:hypothetical protein